MVSAPARSTVSRRPVRTFDRRGLLEQRRGLLDAGQAFHVPEQAFVEAPGRGGAQLERGGADDRVDHFGGRPRDAGADERGGEHERHRDRHAEAGEQLGTACTRRRRR